MNILLLGYGNMGNAMAENLVQHHTLYVVDPIKYTQVTDTSQLTIYRDLLEASRNISVEIDLVFLAVKPQIIDPVLCELKKYFSNTNYMISCVAGISIRHIQSTLNIANTHIARIMPNIAVKTRASLTGLSFSSSFPEDKKSVYKDLLENFGVVLEIPESLMPAITAVSGSGIAFVAKFMEALTLAGVREGLSFDDSYKSCLHTVAGALALLKEDNFETPASFIKSVCSPAGTTIEGIYTLEQNNFSAAVYNAVKKARERTDSISEN